MIRIFALIRFQDTAQSASAGGAFFVSDRNMNRRTYPFIIL